MVASRWTRQLTGAAAGTARLRGSPGSALRPAIQRFGESFAPASAALASARLRLGALHPTSALLRPASDAAVRLRAELAAFRPASDAVMRLVREELAALRPGPDLQVEVVEEGSALGEGSWRVVFPALLRRLRTRWKAVTDALADYNRLKGLYEKITTKPKKQKEAKKPEPQDTAPVPESAAEKTAPTPPTRGSIILSGSAVDEPAGSWAIISRVVVVSGPGEGEFTDADADFAIQWRVPLAVSTIKAWHADLVSAAPVTLGRHQYAYILAVDDDSATFLLRLPHQRQDSRSYLLCDGTTGVATPLPSEFGQLLVDAGAIACAGQMVVELQEQPDGRATLHRFHLGSDERWRHAPATVDFPLGDRPWSGNGAVKHAGRVCFVDLARGLLVCDPRADMPELKFVPLPAGCASDAVDPDHAPKTRCAMESSGYLMYLQMDVHDGGVLLLRTWVLNMDGGWTPRRQVQISSMLFSSPVLACVHPKNTDIVVVCDMFVSPWLLAFDMDSEGVVDAHPLSVPGVPCNELCSSIFHALA